MPIPAQCQQLLTQLRGEFQKNGPNCDKLLVQLKLALAKQGNQLLLEQNLDIAQASREAHELAALMSIRKKDIGAFERQVKQLKVFYRDFPKLPESTNESKIWGLYLLLLLSYDRIAEFHCELELIPHTASLQRPIELERYLMEGNYAKITQAVQALSKEEGYSLFLDKLLETMRRRILESIEKSADSVRVDIALKMLYMKQESELKDYLQQLEKQDTEVRGKWEIVKGRLQLREADMNMLIPSYDTMVNVLGYATEMERIV